MKTSNKFELGNVAFSPFAFFYEQDHASRYMHDQSWRNDDVPSHGGMMACLMLKAINHCILSNLQWPFGKASKWLTGQNLDSGVLLSSRKVLIKQTNQVVLVHDWPG